MDGVATHDQTTTIHIVEHVPYHPTREDDPYYHLFNEARNRMKKLGLLKCWVCGCESNIELHHTEVEFSMAKGVDIGKFAELHPDLVISDDASFSQFVEATSHLVAFHLMTSHLVTSTSSTSRSSSSVVTRRPITADTFHPSSVNVSLREPSTESLWDSVE